MKRLLPTVFLLLAFALPFPSFGQASASPGAKPKPPAVGAPYRAFKDCPECPEMVPIPAGRFLMGAAPG